MWPFNTAAANHAPMHEPELSDAMKRRLDELADRQERQERVLKDIRLEWDEMYDKFRLLYSRLVKRIKDAAKADGDGPQSSEDAPESTNPRAVAYDRPYLGPTSRRNY